MKSFSTYYKMREEDEKGLADIDAMPDEDEMLLKLAKMVISRHRERLIDFLNSLARHDDDIKNTLGKFRDKQRNYLPKDLRSGDEDREKDIIAPSAADTGGTV